MNKNENRLYYVNDTHFFNTIKKKLKEDGKINIDLPELRNFCTELYKFADTHYDFFKANDITCPVRFFNSKYYTIYEQEDWDSFMSSKEDIFNTYNFLINNFYNIDYNVALLGIGIYMPNIKGFVYGSNKNFKTYGEYKEEVFKDLETIRTVSGVYRLYNIDKDLIYIGKSYSLGQRLISSASIQSAIYYDYAVANNKADADIYEIYYISRLKPINNVANNTNDIPSFILKELEFAPIKPLFDLDIDLDKYKFKYNRDMSKWEKVNL
jgi:hypothetical protein